MWVVDIPTYQCTVAYKTCDGNELQWNSSRVVHEAVTLHNECNNSDAFHSLLWVPQSRIAWPVLATSFGANKQGCVQWEHFQNLQSKCHKTQRSYMFMLFNNLNAEYMTGKIPKTKWPSLCPCLRCFLDMHRTLAKVWQKILTNNGTTNAYVSKQLMNLKNCTKITHARKCFIHLFDSLWRIRNQKKSGDGVIPHWTHWRIPQRPSDSLDLSLVSKYCP